MKVAGRKRFALGRIYLPWEGEEVMFLDREFDG